MSSTEYKQGINDDWLKYLPGQIAVLYGGNSAEREISLQSGGAVLRALIDQGIDAVAIDTKESEWLQLVAGNISHCFIALHGEGGEDGKVQGALESLGVSYTGSGVLASAFAMDKLRCKYLWKGMGLSTPDFVQLSEKSDWQSLIDTFGALMVKPSHEGSSIGMAIAENAEELRQAFLCAKEFDCEVMAEQYIRGAEFTVAILGETVLPPIRLETDNVFYDYEAKYISDDTRYICPCGLSAELEIQLKQLANAAFNSLGCKGWGRVDVMQDEKGKFYLLEINTVPGMTNHSLVPMAAKQAGLAFEELVVEILKQSVVVTA